MSSRTVIYEEPSSTSKTLKSSVRQVTQTSSFYNTATTSKNESSKPLTIGSGKQSRPINSAIYHSEIIEDDDDDDDEGEIEYIPADQTKRPSRRSKRIYFRL